LETVVMARDPRLSILNEVKNPIELITYKTEILRPSLRMTLRHSAIVGAVRVITALECRIKVNSRCGKTAAPLRSFCRIE
jgi:hypothetical protein